VDLVLLKHWYRLTSLHLNECHDVTGRLVDFITRHSTLVDLTCFVNITDLDLRRVCKEFSQRQLTKLAIRSAVLTNSGLDYTSLLTELKDFSLADSSKIKSLESLSTNIQRLDIETCLRLRVLDLSKYPNLESLKFSNIRPGFSVTNMFHCTKLTQLVPNHKCMIPLSILANLRHFEISVNPTDPTEADKWLQHSSANLMQIRTLVVRGMEETVTRFGDFPNLESLTLIGIQPKPYATISTLQHLTMLKIAYVICSGEGQLCCNLIHGIEKLTNLETLDLMICQFPDLTNLTRLRSLKFSVACRSLPPPSLFVDHVANIPKLALEKFHLSGVDVNDIRANITHLISQKTLLRELTIGGKSDSLIALKKLMQRQTARVDVLEDKEK